MSRYPGYLKRKMHPMRYLYFTMDDKRRYELTIQGSNATNREFDTKREGRRYDILMTKLEEVGDKGELTADSVVALEDAEFELLVDCLEKVKWTNQGVREAYKVLEWIKDAPSKPTLEGT
jgi:hypothetical protein